MVNGQGTLAGFSQISGMAIDTLGTLFVIDESVIRIVNRSLGGITGHFFSIDDS
jgi:hypothetical protein